MYVTRQSFAETPDSINRAFTTGQTFTPGTMIVTQGGLTVSNFVYVETTGILFDVAPDPLNGVLLWAGEVADESGVPPATNGFWSVSDFRSIFGVTTGSDAAVSFALARADAKLKQYLDADVYADAQLVTPTDAARAVLIRGVAGELTRLYLQESAVISGAIASKSESYRGVKTYSESYTTGASGQLSSAGREGDLLSSLQAWQSVTEPTDATAAAGMVWWGTGRIAY